MKYTIDCSSFSILPCDLHCEQQEEKLCALYFFYTIHTSRMLREEVSGVLEEGGIDLERIVNDEYRVAKELLCTICQGLLWKGKSCASCQHLFCDKCIRTWLQINPTSCPFRCSPYEEKRPPPYIHSLLSRLSIRCRNSSFGCTAVLSYDALEQHETVECLFLTKRCRVCGQSVLTSEFAEHQRFCQSTTITCSLCKQPIDRTVFGKHINECLQQKVNGFFDEVLPLADHPEIPLNNPVMVMQQQQNNNWLTRFNAQLENFAHRLPQVNLRGFEDVVQARHHNIWLRSWSMIRLMYLNPSRIVHIFLPLICFSIGYLFGFLIATSIFIQNQVNRSMHCSFAFIIIISGLISFGLPHLLASINDIWIIAFTVISLLFCGTIAPGMPLVYLKIHQNTIILLLLYAMSLMTFEASILLLRVLVRYIPPYISASCLAWSVIFVTFNIRRMSLNRT